MKINSRLTKKRRKMELCLRIASKLCILDVDEITWKSEIDSKTQLGTDQLPERR